MVYSASGVSAYAMHGDETYFLTRQLVYTFAGIVVFFMAASLPIKFYQSNARAFMFLAILLLFAVYVPVVGHSAGGAQRWLRVGPIQFQPVEFAKLACCIYLADYVSRKSAEIQTGGWKVFVPMFFLVGFVGILTLLEPDLGSFAIVAFITAIILFLGGLMIRYILSILIVFVPMFYFLIIKVPYRLSRLQAYLNPWEDPQGSGFQIIQSFLAIGSGGAWGVGLGKSSQKLFYLPSSHNDFILAILSEELGLAGILVVVLLYIAFFIASIRITKKAEQPFEKLLATSVSLLIILQAIFHMMVATGLVPTKGLPLPFVSYGGSSIFMSLFAVGILMAIDRKNKKRKA